MDFKITPLDPADFNKCSDIWDMKQQENFAKQFSEQLLSGNRFTYVCQSGNDFIGEISLVFDMNDSDYTAGGRRVYVSHLIVKKEARRKGVGTQLVNFAVERAKEMGCSELSIGVDLNNYPALKLYIDLGFDKIIFIGKDSQGEYVKLLKTI